MRASMKASEWADWMEAWCVECAHDHEQTHAHSLSGKDAGCVLLAIGITEDVPEWIDHDTNGLHNTIPADMECTHFAQCTSCDEDPTPYKLGNGMVGTHREIAEVLRAAVIALPPAIGDGEGG